MHTKLKQKKIKRKTKWRTQKAEYGENGRRNENVKRKTLDKKMTEK